MFAHGFISHPSRSGPQNILAGMNDSLERKSQGHVCGR